MNINIEILVGSRSTACDRSDADFAFRVGVGAADDEGSVPFVIVVPSDSPAAFLLIVMALLSHIEKE